MNKNPTDATVCRYLFTAKLLYMFRVSKHPSSGVLKTLSAASGTGRTTCTATSLQRSLIGTPDDGCCDSRNIKSNFAVNKYLHTVASVGFLFTLVLIRLDLLIFFSHLEMLLSCLLGKNILIFFTII